MKPYYQDSWFTLYEGNSVDVLRNLESVQLDCVITSPPYYGLRDYGTGNWLGGEVGCAHGNARRKTRYSYDLPHTRMHDGNHLGTDAVPGLFRDCPDCGAKRVDDQIGLEESDSEYVVRLVEVFTTVKRLLAPTATLWVNIGDSYVDRQLAGIPWAFAEAMKQAQFTLLADVIWLKPNAQPTSVKHRPSLAHEYIFMFGVSSKNYYGYDEVKEPMAAASLIRMKTPRIGDNNKSQSGNYAVVKPEYSDTEREGWRNMRSVWSIATESFPGTHYAVFPTKLVRRCILAGCPPNGTVLDPFIGSGTTAVVARSLSRRCIGIDLKGDYCQDAVRRFQGRNLVLEAAGQTSLFDLEVDPAYAGSDQHRPFSGNGADTELARPKLFGRSAAENVATTAGEDAT